MKKVYQLKNLDCANCAAKMESKIRKIKGVEEADVNFFSQKLLIQAEESSLETVMEEVVKICKKIEPDCEIVR